MSAETIPAEVATDLDCIRWYVECLDAVAFKRRAVAGLAEAEGSYNAAMKRLTDLSTRPAEPAAPVAEAGDGDVAASLAHLNIGYLYGIADALEHTDFNRAGDIRQCLLQVVKGLSTSAATLEAERARADELRRERDETLVRAENAERWTLIMVRNAKGVVSAAEQRAADALARAEKAEEALETAREDERDRLYGIALKDMEGRSMRAQHSHSAALWLRLEGAMDTYSRLAARSAATETATDGGEA